MTFPDKIKLIHQSTCIQKLRNSYYGTNVYVKRDDLIDFGFGGNKVRMAEYIAAVAVARKSTKIITFGSTHSNHVRVIACMCNYLGLDCDLIILREQEDSAIGGNYMLLRQLDRVNIVYCNAAEARGFIDKYLADQALEGVKYLWVPGGGHMAEAAFAYCEAAREILRQQETLGVSFEAVFLPCGTGTTQAGLVMGLQDADICVIGMTVARPPQRCVQEIRSLLQCTDDTHSEWEIQVRDSQIPYGKTTHAVVETAKALARSDGLFLDPIYNAKSFWSMTECLKENHYGNVLYLDTGGTPNIF